MPPSLFSDAYRPVLDALMDARASAGLSQAALAQRLGKTQPFISKIESGVRRVDILEFCAIARALNIEPSDLLVRIERTLPTDIPI